MTAPWYSDGGLHFGVGIEDTFVPQSRPGERAIDEYTLTEHDVRWHDDLALAHAAGATFVRWGIPWYQIAPERGTWKWDWVDAVMARFGELDLRPIVDLLHYGTPLWLEREFDNPDFPEHFAEFGARVAERYTDVANDYTPINEPMIHALFCGDYAYWPPYLSGDDGLVRMSLQLARGFVGVQRAIADVASNDVAFVHVDAGMRYEGDVEAPEHRELVARLRQQVWLVEDLVTGRVGPDHPLATFLTSHGANDADLAMFQVRPVEPDVVGVNYYPRHSTEIFERGVSHRGGFADPRPTRDDGVTGLLELLDDAQSRYGKPVMVSETCVTASVAIREAWMTDSIAALAAARGAGAEIVGYTWWPLFDMYEWTYRHSAAPREDHRLRMGLWELAEGAGGLERVKTPLVDAFHRHATSDRHRPKIRSIPKASAPRDKE